MTVRPLITCLYLPKDIKFFTDHVRAETCRCYIGQEGPSQCQNWRARYIGDYNGPSLWADQILNNQHLQRQNPCSLSSRLQGPISTFHILFTHIYVAHTTNNIKARTRDTAQITIFITAMMTLVS